MNKSQLIRYIVRLLATVLNIWSCAILAVLSAAYLNVYFYIIRKAISSPERLFLIFWGGGGALFALAWTVGCVLFTILFIRSLFATTEARYPKKLFRRLGAGIAWAYILNTLGLISQISMYIPNEVDDVSSGILIYLLGLGASLLMLVPALQFWRPSATKTWVLNALPLLLCIPMLFLKKEYLDLGWARIMQLLF